MLNNISCVDKKEAKLDVKNNAITRKKIGCYIGR